VAQVPCTPMQTSCSLLHWNKALALELGLNANNAPPSPEFIAVLVGNAAWPEYNSVASVYCGHQFGVFVPQLGDGRALMIAELRHGATYRQLQLKGAGPTPYSRHADGRAVLRSSIREYLASEAMRGLGIPTTQALSICASNDLVYRETPETAAVVCRVAESFLRFGHVEFFAHTQQLEALKELLEWHIEQHHPDIQLGNTESEFSEGVLAWLSCVSQRTAELVAKWQSVGFCHGVMNTDNMSLLGLTIDYGPYGFMDSFDIDHICNHSDQQGRYSYRNQPRMAHWNVYALAHAISTLIPSAPDKTQAIVNDFPDIYHHNHTQLFAQKLGFFEPMQDDNVEPLIESTLHLLHAHQLDFTRFFRSLSALNPKQTVLENFGLWQRTSFFPLILGEEEQVEAGKTWLEAWVQCHRAHPQALLATPMKWQDQMDATNPAFVLRNHLLQTAIEQTQQGELKALEALFSASQNPYSSVLDAHLIAPPPAWAKHLVLSCSS
jgi:uncharacterized protein YdiU (UPF0061 family)